MAQLWALANNRDTSSVCKTAFTDSDSGPRSCAESVAFVPFLTLKFLMVSEQKKCSFVAAFANYVASGESRLYQQSIFPTVSWWLLLEESHKCRKAGCFTRGVSSQSGSQRKCQFLMAGVGEVSY